MSRSQFCLKRLCGLIHKLDSDLYLPGFGV